MDLIGHIQRHTLLLLIKLNLNDIKKITFFVDECQRQNIPVLGPDINESDLNFMVNDKGEIRFGLAAIKNVGENAALGIIEEREEKGPYKTIFDLTKRINLRAVNKRSLEALAMAGAFDGFENTHRFQFFYREDTEDTIFLEKIVKHAADYQHQQNSSQASLFGDMEDIEIKEPEMPVCDPWTKLEQLKNEKEVTGFYMSGHPLEDFKIEIDNFCNITINEIKNNLSQYKNKNITFAGILTSVNNRISKTGNPFATFVIEDFADFNQFILFSEDYLRLKHFLIEGTSLLVKAKVVVRNNKNRDQLDVRISSILLLSEALERNTNKILLKLSLDTITEKFITQIDDIIKKATGNCKLKFQVTDLEDKTEVTLPSGNLTVGASEFLRGIRDFEGVDYKLS
jgi:DNA polymerase-3 subunit alpha